MAAKKSAKKAITKTTKPSAKRSRASESTTKPATKKASKKPASAASRAQAAPKAAPKAVAAKAKASPAANKAPAAKKPAPPAAPAASGKAVDAGSLAPAFDLVDQSGARVTSKSLAGKPYVLYFYPKDSTPGCTQEACDFRDRHPAFEKAKVRIFGVSGDSEKSHRSFADKHSLPFSLLVDEGNALATAYGAYGPKKLYGREFLGIIRSTFVVGADGKILKAYRGVKVSGHVDAVFSEVSGL